MYDNVGILATKLYSTETLVPRETIQGKALQPGTVTDFRVAVDPVPECKWNNNWIALNVSYGRVDWEEEREVKKMITAIPEGSSRNDRNEEEGTNSNGDLKHFD